MNIIDKRYYKLVSATTTSINDYVIPVGQTLEIMCWGGDAGSSPDTTVALIWDPDGIAEVLYATHGGSEQKGSPLREIVGDGLKKLQIKLTNDQVTADYLGGFYGGFLRG